MPAAKDLLFGKIAVALRFCSAAQVDAALAIQSAADRPMPLGRHLVEEGYLTEDQHAQVLERQRRNLARPDTATQTPKSDVLFGRLAVREGLATEEQVNAALREQGKDGDRRSLGEILQTQGVLKAAEVAWLLGRQSKWVMRCPACKITLTVHSSSKTPTKAACPRCGIALEAATPAAATESKGEVDTSVRMGPPPRRAEGASSGCRICEHPFVGEPGSDGRVECLSCRVRFTP